MKAPVYKSKSVKDCFKRWRVNVNDRVLEFFKDLGLAEELEAWRNGLERELNTDPKAIFKLLKEPVVFEYEDENGKVKIRRYRLYLRGLSFRLLFTISVEHCLV